MITIYLKLNTAGLNTGPFNILTSPDGITYTLFKPSVSKTSLTSGITYYDAPNGTTKVRITSISLYCTNSIDITLGQQYMLDYTLFGGGPVPPSTVNLASPYATLLIKINGATIVSLGGDNPVAVDTGIISFNSNDAIYIYTDTRADSAYYSAAALSLDIADDFEYTPPVIYGVGGNITVNPINHLFEAYHEYYKPSTELWNSNIWIKAQAEANLIVI